MNEKLYLLNVSNNYIKQAWHATIYVQLILLCARFSPRLLQLLLVLGEVYGQFFFLKRMNIVIMKLKL